MSYILSLLLILIPALGFSQSTNNTDPMQVEGRIEPNTLAGGQGGEIVLDLKLPPEFHAYAEQFKVLILQPDGFQYHDHKITPVVEFYDKFSKRNRKGIQNSATLSLPFEVPTKLDMSQNRILVELTYQACSNTYCLFPTKKEISLPVQWKDKPVEEKKSLSSVWNGDSVKKALEENLILAFILVFLSGILTSFTPCIFPMIPITLAILGHDSEKRGRHQNFLLSVSYVVGIATTYSILGLIAATSGMLFGSALSNPIVLTVICAIFFLMALSMYGVYEIQVPSFLRQISSKHKAGASYTGAYFSGIIAGVVASPCVGPVLVTLLTFVASTGNKVLGFFLLFDYAVGLGVIFLVLGLFTQLTKKLPRSGPWMDGMKFLLGSFMLGAFFYYLGFLIPQRIHDGLVGIAMIVVASFFGAFLNPNGNKLRRIQKGLMLGLLVVGFGFVVVASLDLRPQLTNQFTGPVEVPKVAADWQPYSEVLLAQAKAEGKPVVIDFFADWCLACHELDEKTFQIDEVKSALSGFYKLRFDATKESQELNDLRKKYGIQGLPTIIFIGKDGNWRQDLTLTEFEPPAKFLERLGKF